MKKLGEFQHDIVKEMEEVDGGGVWTPQNVDSTHYKKRTSTEMNFWEFDNQTDHYSSRKKKIQNQVDEKNGG